MNYQRHKTLSVLRNALKKGSICEKHGAWHWRRYEGGKQISTRIVKVSDEFATVEDVIPLANRLYEAQDRLSIVAEHIELDPSNFRRLSGPGVYVWWDGNKPLYVGKSSQLLGRAGSPGHHRAWARECATRITLYFTGTEPDAYALETRLIHELKPVLNRESTGCPIGRYVVSTRNQQLTANSVHIGDVL